MGYPKVRSHVLTALALLGLALCGAGFSHAAARGAALPEQSPDGLRLVQNTQMAVVYMKDGADFSSYDKVAILDCFVAFRKDWERDQNQDCLLYTSPSPRDRTRSRLPSSA